MFTEMAKYTKREHCEVVWKCLLNAVDALRREGDTEDVRSEKLKFLVQLLEIWTAWKQGALIFDAAQLQKVCECYSMTGTSGLRKLH